MTFSDPKVAESVNANFVSAWINRGPGFHNEDYSTESWIFNSAMEAYTTKNICTFFLAPDGKVFHYVAGYYSPDVFKTYIDVAQQIRKAAFDERMQLKADGAGQAKFIHSEVLKIIRKTEAGMTESLKAKDGWKAALDGYDTYTYRDVKHVHQAQCANNLREGYRYLAKLHQHFSERTSLPDLKEVQFTYLWGNPFTEEAPGSTPIDNGMGMRDVRRKCNCD